MSSGPDRLRARHALPLAAIVGALLLLAGASAATDALLNPLLAAQPRNAPEQANLAVQIPAGSVGSATPASASCRSCRRSRNGATAAEVGADVPAQPPAWAVGR